MALLLAAASLLVLCKDGQGCRSPEPLPLGWASPCQGWPSRGSLSPCMQSGAGKQGAGQSPGQSGEKQCAHCRDQCGGHHVAWRTAHGLGWRPGCWACRPEISQRAQLGPSPALRTPWGGELPHGPPFCSALSFLGAFTRSPHWTSKSRQLTRYTRIFLPPLRRPGLPAPVSYFSLSLEGLRYEGSLFHAGDAKAALQPSEELGPRGARGRLCAFWDDPSAGREARRTSRGGLMIRILRAD